MKNNNGNTLYIHRIIKLISPITCQTFKIELNGEEDELRELLGTILEINPKSIKGLRDSFNNYYTLSSAVKNPMLNTDPYNYYTVVIKGIGHSNDIKYIKYPSLNLSNKDQISNDRFNYEKNYENKTMNFLDQDDNYYHPNLGKNKTKDFLKFSSELYKRNYIDKNLKQKLDQLIKENNIEVISILNPYLNSKKSYDELAQKIKPVISSSSQNSESKEDSKFNSSKESSHSKHKKKHKHKSHHTDKSKDKDKDKNKSNNKKDKKDNTTKEEKILNDIKLNFDKDKFSKLKELLKKKNPAIIKSIKLFEKDNDYNHLISKLNSISYKVDSEEGSNGDSNESNEQSEDDSDMKKNDSSDYIKEESKKSKNDTTEGKDKLKNITKKIYSALKKIRKDLFFIAKFDLDKRKPEEKKNLFKKKFKLNLNKINNENNYKIPKKNISIIENYYTDFILKKVFKNFNEDEKSIYEELYEDNDENNVIHQIYKDLIKHKDLNKMKSQLKKIIEEAEKMEIEGEEKEDDDNKKSDIKEENEEEEEEDYEGEEDEENEGDENDDDDKKDDSSSNNFILNNNDKDATAKVLNNNYKKNYHFSNFANSNNKNSEAKSKSKNKSKDNSVDKSEKEEKKNDREENNLGLNFVVIKPKKVNKEEEKKDQSSIEENNNNFILNKAQENSISVSNANKKINAFISQIEHIKKIDEIKKPLIEAIHKNNIYIMELFEKFQKNKSILNKKSLYDVFNKIKNNPEATKNSGENDKKFNSFKALVQNIKELDETQKEFVCSDPQFMGAYNTYEEFQDIDDFNETIVMMLKKKVNKELFVQFCVKKKKEAGNGDIMQDSKDLIKILKQNELYNENDCNIMETYLGKDDGLFLGIFRELLKTNNLKEFMENMNLALSTKKKEGNSKDNKLKWDNEIIKKNFEQLKENMEEKFYKGLNELFQRKSEKLFNILQDLNSTNLKKKIETVTVLILKKELSPT